MDEPAGLDGELVDRLIGAINAPADSDWVDLAFFVLLSVGGTEVSSVVADTGHEPPPGSVGAKRRETHEVVSRQAYFERMRARLTRLVRSGVRENFLVRALRDELTARCQEMARTEEGDTRREELRANLERYAKDPDWIAEFRKRVAKRDPQAASLSDEEVAERLHAMERFARPIPKEKAEESWARVTRWQQKAEAISNHAIAVWFDRYLKRMTRDS